MQLLLRLSLLLGHLFSGFDKGNQISLLLWHLQLQLERGVALMGASEGSYIAFW